jgi:gas vesicle protein
MIASGRPQESGGTPGVPQDELPFSTGTLGTPKEHTVTQVTIRRLLNAISKPSPTSTVPSMSYAGPVSRNRASNQGRGTTPRPIGASESRTAPPKPVDTPSDEERAPGETDWREVAIFGAGLALGLALGAGAALLAAPQTGEETRAAIKGRVRRIKRTTSRRGRDAWADLGDELRGAARSLSRRRAKRRLRRELDRESSRELVGG